MDLGMDALFGLIGVIAGSLITSYGQRAKVKSENDNTAAKTNEVIRQTVMALMKPLQDRVDDLEKELSDWMDWANRLVTQIKGLGCEPVPFKPKRK